MMIKNIKQIAKEKDIIKVCVNGIIMDIRQLDQTPFNTIPNHIEIMKNSMYNEPILFCY